MWPNSGVPGEILVLPPASTGSYANRSFPLLLFSSFPSLNGIPNAHGGFSWPLLIPPITRSLSKWLLSHRGLNRSTPKHKYYQYVRGSLWIQGSDSQRLPHSFSTKRKKSPVFLPGLERQWLLRRLLLFVCMMPLWFIRSLIRLLAADLEILFSLFFLIICWAEHSCVSLSRLPTIVCVVHTHYYCMLWLFSHLESNKAESLIPSKKIKIKINFIPST